MYYMKLLAILSFGLVSLALISMPARAQDISGVTIGVTSPAVRFSPGNWSGDNGRGGDIYRQSWVPGAWVKFYWSTTSTTPSASLLITNANQNNAISYFVDGKFTDNIQAPTTGSVVIAGLSGSGPHELDVYLKTSEQAARWNNGSSWRVAGLLLDSGATPSIAPKLRPWVLEIGDSITEGVAADNGSSSNLADYSFLTGQALNQAGYDYSLSACGWSGWIYPGDNHGDVPPYYTVVGGVYDEGKSRWDKIDQSTSLLDSSRQISAYGQSGQTPAMITINYGTNEAIHLTNFDYLPKSIEGTLAALRSAAPNAWIVVYVPFNLYSQSIYPKGVEVIDILKKSVGEYKTAHPRDLRTVLVDYGPDFSQMVVTDGGGQVHPNLMGHALIAAHTISTVIGILSGRQ
jgi:hypothetical protein